MDMLMKVYVTKELVASKSSTQASDGLTPMTEHLR